MSAACLPIPRFLFVSDQHIPYLPRSYSHKNEHAIANQGTPDIRNLLGGVDLVNRLIETQVILDGIPQLAAFESGSSAVNYHDDV